MWNNTTKSLLSFLHQLTKWHRSHLLLSAVCIAAAAERRRAAINGYLLPAMPTAANPLLQDAAAE